MGTGLTITGVETFLTQPGTQRLVVVKVRTSEPDLYGLGCATFTQRHRAVEAAITHHIAPLIVGRNPCDIEDIWHTAMVNGYWRNGPVLNNAVSGVDMALWDIKGKLAGMPCWQLFGGRSRPAAAVYVHAGGRTPEEVIGEVARWKEKGFRYIRCQLGGYAGIERQFPKPDGSPRGAYFDPRERLWSIPDLFDRVRAEFGWSVELLHDVHERLAPVDAAFLAKALEPHRLFFLEDILAPEDLDWFRHIRNICATPLAMGELWNNPAEILPLVSNRLIDFVRCHLSQIGGITPALKLAHLCEPFGIRTAWHGPADVSPIGMAANLHLDIACHNFGIQEWSFRSEAELEIFPGFPEVREGYAYPNDRPGLGVEFDEKRAKRFPCDDRVPEWTECRKPDGSIGRP